WRRTAGGGKRSGGRWNKNLKSCIADIIRWVADEKEARGYLQALATKMTEELEYLKIVLVYGHSRSAFFDHPGVCSSQMRDTAAAVCEGLSRPGPALHSREDTAQVGGAESDPGRAAAQPAARELGSSRCEMSRTLPSCCTAEIQAKQQVGEELSRTRAELLHSQRELLETRQRLDALAHDMKRKEQHIREMQTRLDAPHQPSNSFLDRPASQLSYLDQFLSEAPTERHYDNVPLVNNEEKKLHQFLVRTFSSPTKCNHCTSLMIGLTRQGVVCETCGLAVHTSCCARVASRCPLPASRSRRPLGIDPARGQGTAYEGYVKITRTAARRCRIAELRAPGAVHSVQLARGRLLLGYRGGFAAHALPDPRRPTTTSPPSNQVNLFLSHSGARPLCAAAVPNSADTLLVFNSLALYTSTTSRVGTNARPLDASGWLCCVCGGATNGFPFGSDTTPFIIYLRPLLAKGPLNVEHAALWGSTKRRSERRSRLISAPTNFAHLSHMGPGDGIRSQRLLDLPTTVETADDLPQMYSSRESSKRTSPLTISHGTGSYNGSWRATRPRDGPPPAPDAPPSPPLSHHRPMERSIGGGSQGSGSLLERSITPLSLGSMSSLHDVLKVGTEAADALHSEDSSCGASPPHPHDP
ncbi:hypothetical protein MSG28_015760, partial [Choristoneura fumiferana]